MLIKPTDYEQYMLELLNWSRAHPVAQASELGIAVDTRLDPGQISPAAKQPLVFNDRLIEAARDHSAWMLATNKFSHTSERGMEANDRMAEAGYVFELPWSWGENIGWQSMNARLDFVGAVRVIHEGLFESEGHRLNLLDEEFVEIGIGIHEGGFRSGRIEYEVAMATQNFAYSGDTDAFLTGVIFNDSNGDGRYDPGEGIGGVAVTARGPQGVFSTTSWEAGGYQLSLPAGHYEVRFVHEGLQSATRVSIGERNIKVDRTLQEMEAARSGWVEGAAHPLVVEIRADGTVRIEGAGMDIAVHRPEFGHIEVGMFFPGLDFSAGLGDVG